MKDTDGPDSGGMNSALPFCLGEGGLPDIDSARTPKADSFALVISPDKQPSSEHTCLCLILESCAALSVRYVWRRVGLSAGSVRPPANGAFSEVEHIVLSKSA